MKKYLAREITPIKLFFLINIVICSLAMLYMYYMYILHMQLNFGKLMERQIRCLIDMSD